MYTYSGTRRSRADTWAPGTSWKSPVNAIAPAFAPGDPGDPVGTAHDAGPRAGHRRGRVQQLCCG